MKKILITLAVCGLITAVAAGHYLYKKKNAPPITPSTPTSHSGGLKISNLFLKRDDPAVTPYVEKKTPDKNIRKTYTDAEITFSYPGDVRFSALSPNNEKDETWSNAIYEDGEIYGTPITVLQREPTSLDAKLKELQPFISKQESLKMECGTGVKLTLTNSAYGPYTQYLFYNEKNLYFISGWEGSDFEDNELIASTFKFINCVAPTTAK